MTPTPPAEDKPRITVEEYAVRFRVMYEAAQREGRSAEPETSHESSDEELDAAAEPKPHRPQVDSEKK